MNNKKKIIIITLIIIVIAITAGLYLNWRGKKKKITTNLQATPTTTSITTNSKLIIKVNPNNTKVIISGINSSFFEEHVGSFETQVPAEKLFITAFLPYYENSNQEIEMKKGKTTNLEFNLERLGRDITEGAPIEGLNNNSNYNNLIPNP